MTRAPQLSPTQATVVAVALCLTGALLGLLASPTGQLSFSVFSDTGVNLLWLRIPRVLLGGIVGFSLAAAGATLQTILQNPLADPFVIGVSGGAATGGALAVLLTGSTALAAVGTASVAGATVVSLALSWFLRTDRSDDGNAALLAGVAANSFAAAAVTVIKSLLPPEENQGLLFWLMGRLDYLQLGPVIGVGVLNAILVLWLFRRARGLGLLVWGRDEAIRLGVDADALRKEAYVVVSVLVGLTIPLAGMIGFVGLLVPHLVRLLVGPHLRHLLMVGAPLGAALLMAFDGLSRLLFPLVGTEIPVGALTAAFGAPVFVWVLVRHLRGQL